jgi:hypothetical protein
MYSVRWALFNVHLGEVDEIIPGPGIPPVEANAVKLKIDFSVLSILTRTLLQYTHT